jgi:hypothetical protein
MTFRLRLGSVVRAALFGWIAGWLAGLPLQLLEAIRNAGFDTRLFGEMLTFSIALYALLTFAVASYWCCIFLLPAIWILSPATILAHRITWTTLNALFGFALMALRAHVWTSLEHDGVGLANFWLWALFASVFFAVTAEIYVRQIKKALAVSTAVTSLS